MAIPQVQDVGMKCSLDEKEAIIANLQKSVVEKDSMLENLRDLLQGQALGESAKEDLFNQLTAKLKDKERQLQVNFLFSSAGWKVKGKENYVRTKDVYCSFVFVCMEALS